MSISSALHDERVNGLLGWAFTAVVAAAAIGHLVTGDLTWGGFWLLAVAVTVLPAVVAREWTVFVPWPLPLCAVGAVTLQGADLYPELAGYVAIATLALVAVVELDQFTEVEMSRRFTVVFAVMTTMSLKALWTVVQFVSDRWLGTEFIRSQTELQWDLVFVTVVALVMGSAFVWYFERLDGVESADRRVVPDESP
jgi:hypothetical protein